MYELVNKGAHSKITAASAAEVFDKRIQKFLMQLQNENLSDFIASGAHNTTNRTFKMEKEYSAVKSDPGNETVYHIMENPELLIAGKIIDGENPEDQNKIVSRVILDLCVKGEHYIEIEPHLIVTCSIL